MPRCCFKRFKWKESIVTWTYSGFNPTPHFICDTDETTENIHCCTACCVCAWGHCWIMQLCFGWRKSITAWYLEAWRDGEGRTCNHVGAAQSIATMMRLHRQSGSIEIGADCSLLEDGVGLSWMVLSHRWRYAPVVARLLRSGCDSLRSACLGGSDGKNINRL